MSLRDDSPEEPSMTELGSTDFHASWDSAGHASEDTVYARLDGALGEADCDAVDVHIATCVECRALLAEARGYIAASARILHAADVVPGKVVPIDDVARTAARIVAMADDRDTRDGPVVRRAEAPHIARAWAFANNPAIRIAAALVMMVGAALLGRALLHRPGNGDYRVEASAPVATVNTKKSDSVPALADVAKPAMPSTTPVSSSPKVLAVAPPGRSGLSAIKKKERVTAQQLAEVSVQAQANSKQIRSAGFSIASVSVAEHKTEPVVSGVIIDAETKRPVANAHVQIAGTTISAMTGEDGRFVLRSVPEAASILQVRRIGYGMLDVGLDSVSRTGAIVSVALRAATIQLDAVVTSALGAPKTANRCVVLDAELAGSAEPVVRRISLELSAPDAYVVILKGWPSSGAETEATLTSDASKTLRGSATSGDMRIDIELIPRGENWFSTIREYRGANIRAFNVRYFNNSAASDCR